MGWTSEVVAQTYNISREKQDHYAHISHSRAEKVAVLVTTIPLAFPDQNAVFYTSSMIPPGPRSR